MAVESSRQTSGDEPFVLVDEVRPSEAEHVYDHFFSEYNVDAYTPTLVQQVHARRARPELNGRLFFDELLSMAFEVSVESAKSIYAPSAGKNGLVALIERISSSSFDRIRRMALLFYLLLDLDEYNGSTQGTTHFAQRVSLPRSVRHAMTGYWNMDKGKYRVAVSYLQQPDFVPHFLEILSPLRTASTSAEEGRECAHAFSSFLKLIKPDETALSDDFKEARVVSVCYTEGVRAAWLHCQELITPNGGEEEEREMMRCVSRIVEYCFMPQPKAADVQSLIALPLTVPEEALLAHVIVNPPPNVNLSSSAHAKAIDVLMIRYINSGQYVDAVLLDRRVNASLGLMHLTGDVNDEAEREKLRTLRTKRQSLVKAAYSVLTHVERTLLRLGDEAYADEGEEEVGSESSWERVPAGEGSRAESAHVAGETSILSNAAGSSRLTPLTASPILRKSGQANEGDPLLAAIARSRLQQVKGSPSNKSVRRSSTHNVFAASPLAGEGRNSLRDSISSIRATPVPPALDETSIVGDVSVPSPLATKKPYRLGGMERESTVERSKALVSDDTSMATDVDQSRDVQEGPEDVAMASGPMAQLALQLEEEMKRNHGAVDEILSKSSPSANVSPFRVMPKNAHSTLAFTRTPRRYEARYEIGGKVNDKTDVQGDAVMAVDAPREQRGDTAEEVPRQRQARRAPASNARARKTRANRTTAKGHDANAERELNDGDTSVPGSFPEETQGAERARRDTEQEDEDADVVPEMTQTPNVRRSRSAASGLTTKPKSSTPLRRSSRLSVEPDAQAMDEDEQTTSKPRAGKRAASPNKAGKKATGKSTNARTTRATSQAPSDVTDDAPMMTRSSSRLKAVSSSNTDAIPGAF